MKDDLDPIVQTWINEIDDAKKREKQFREDGKEINQIYGGEAKEKVPFNILFSNTETLLPAVFSNQPRPIVKRRFYTEDSPLVAAGAKAATRMLEYFLDTNVDGYARFEETMTSVTLDALLPGRGISTIKYDASLKGDGDDEEVEFETVCAAAEKWDRTTFGFAHKWEDVPWKSTEAYIDEDEASELFDKKIVSKIKFTTGEEDEEDSHISSRRDPLKHIGNRKTALIYKIWDKKEKKVHYISPQYKDGYLKSDDDPLGITGFFDCPRPLQFIEKSCDLMPVALYELYRNQAEELNTIQVRINRLIKAIKARGLYDGSLGDEVASLMEEDENALLPTDKSASLMDGGFDKLIWFMPVEKLIQTVQQLYQARESCKQVIYEITGISDVIRGSTKASETLGAQKMKESWGTMRLQRLQKRVQTYARDTLRIMLDVAVNKLSVDTWAKTTGLPYPTAEQKQSAQQFLENQKKEFEMKAMQAQQMGQQIPPPQPDPQALQASQSPSWDEILEFLQDDYIRSYKVDIETNSTLEAEATEDKQMIAEFMNAMAQLLNGIGPMVQQGIMPFEAVKSMLKQITRRFRFGDDVEEQLEQMQPPQKEADPEQEKMQKQFQQAQEQFGKEKQKFEQEKQKAGDDLDKRYQEFDKAVMEFNYDKKLYNEQIKMQQQINKVILDSDQKVASTEMKAMLKESEARSKSVTQSMIDKHQNFVKDQVRDSQPQEQKETKVEITNMLPSENKKISIIHDENGRPIGADVEAGE